MGTQGRDKKASWFQYRVGGHSPMSSAFSPKCLQMYQGLDSPRLNSKRCPVPELVLPCVSKPERARSLLLSKGSRHGALVQPRRRRHGVFRSLRMHATKRWDHSV